MANNRIVELKEEVFRYVQRNGPILPSQVAKSFKGTNLFISALLSELVTNKKLKLTKAKVGGSPLYYAQGQEERLYSMLREHVGGKPKEALDTLKEKRVLRDRDCLPFERVALRELHDFAKPVRLVVNDTEELFWRWYLLADGDAKDMISEILDRIYNHKEEKVEEKKEEVLEKVEEEVEPEIIAKPEPEPVAKVEPKKEVEKKPSIVKKPKKAKVKKEPVVEKVLETKEEVQKKLDAPEEVSWDTEDEFLDFVKEHLENKEIKILNMELVKKGREANLMVLVPSNAGELKYFVKARRKKKLTEGDILLGFTEAQEKKLPLLYLSNASLTKKALGYIDKNLPGMTYIQLENLE